MTNNHTFFTIYNALSGQDEPQPSWINAGEFYYYIATITNEEPRLLTYTYDHQKAGYFHTKTETFSTQLELEQRMRNFLMPWLPYYDDASMFPSAFYEPPKIGLSNSQQPTVITVDIDDTQPIVPVREHYECIQAHSMRFIGSYITEGGESYDLYECKECGYEQKIYDIGGIP